MKRSCVVTVTGVCLMLSIGATGGGSGDRDFDSLVKRVSKLEKETTAQKKAIAHLEKEFSEMRKDAATADKKSKATEDRCDVRTLLLAKWMDGHHPRQGRGRYHRDEIARRK